jgi:hypothetical protein
MKPILKKVFALIAVVGALASVVAGREKPSYAPAREPVARIETRLPDAGDLDVARLQARSDDGAKVDAFAQRDFAPRAPAEAHAAAKREAPPLPFRYLGKMLDSGKLEVFLANGNESVVAKAGERIGDYRIESVSEAAVVFTYLPMKTKQTLPL